jgi:hypothetical protein
MTSDSTAEEKTVMERFGFITETRTAPPPPAKPITGDRAMEQIASWVIVRKSDNTAVFETFNKRVAQAINTDKYLAVPIEQYLGNLNAQTKAANS